MHYISLIFEKKVGMLLFIHSQGGFLVLDISAEMFIQQPEALMPDVLTCQSSLFSNCFAKIRPICLFSFSSLQGSQINSKFITPTPQTKHGSGIMHPLILIYK